ncbi:MAG: sugar phosphate isomerase/epimerase family protein [Armatimonadota bacterium]|nr:sugar phosphate isomerase/epimerase family protein [Armatimonadota bacterium]
MKAGFATIALRSLDVFEAIDLAAAAGFESIEVWGRAPHTTDPYDEKHTLAVRDRILAGGMEPMIFGSYVNSAAPDVQDKMEICLKIAENLGSKIIRIWAGDKEPPLASDEDWTKNAANLRWMALKAADKGITLAMEMHCGTLALTAEGVVHLIETSGVDNLKLNYQVANPGEPDIDRVLGLVGHHVVMMHAQNCVHAPEGAQHAWDRALIGEGLIDYQYVVNCLKTYGFDGCVEVEFLKGDPDKDLMVEAMKKDAEYLRKITSS